MSSIFVFPGQGAQAVGMGRDLYENNAAAHAVFDAVDDALSEKLSDIIFNGPMDTLTLSRNVQPAIFAVSIAMLRAADVPMADFVAGHSLGEYSALAAAGAMSIADTARLLRLRGDAMQAAVPVGRGLVSVIMGMDIDVVRSICTAAEERAHGEGIDGIVDVANDNCPGQVAISGTKEVVEIAIEIAKEQGARRAMPLALSAPVHCRLQEKTADIMRDALSKIEIKIPNATFIANKTAAAMMNPDDIRDELVYQITHGVRWRESVMNMPALGITDMIEVGPGSVLTGLCGRCTTEIQAHKLGE